MAIDNKDCERKTAEEKLLIELREAEETVKDGNRWLTLDELKIIVGE